MMKKKIAMSVLVFSLLFAVAGCSDSSKADTANSDAGVSAAVDSEIAEETERQLNSITEDKAEDEMEDIDPETMELIKYNIYVRMNNYMIEILEDIYSYYAVVEYADEFVFVPDSGLEYRYNISLYDTSIIDDALAAAEMEPKFEVMDELVVEIAEPMRTLMDTFSNIHDCYDFADNRYAKAKEYHALVQANVAVFEELAYSFMDEIDILSTERVMEAEQKMLEDGRLIIYNSSRAITIVEQIISECSAQEIYDDNLIELDLTEIKPLYDELVATVADYEEAVNDPNQLMEESLPGSPMRSLNSLVQAVEWMIKQVENQTPISDPGLSPLGSIGHIEEVLSDCIDQYNSAFAE